MKAALLLLLFAAAWVPLRAENWTTSDGKTYQNVQVISHDAAYVTILHENGGGRIPLSTLPPALQKHFGYDPAKAAAEIAADKIAEKKNQEALAREKHQAQVAAEEGDSAMDAAVAQAALPPPPPDVNASTAPPPPATTGSEVPPGGPTEIDDYGPYAGYGYGGYGGYGYYGGYGGYGYGLGAYSTGYRGGIGYHNGTQGFSRGNYGVSGYRPGVGGEGSAFPGTRR